MSTSTARAAIFETLQVGVETASAPGTAVPADLRFTQTKMTAKPQVMTEDVEEQGGKGPVDIIVGKEMTTLQATGICNVTDFFYLLATAVCRPKQLSTAYKKEMAINQDGPDDKLTLTLQMGGERGRSQVSGVQAKSFEIKMTPDKAPTYSFNLFGRKYDETLSNLTANPTRLLTSPFGPKGVSIFIADTLAGLDNENAKLSNGMLLDATLKLDNVASELFGIEDTDSYSDTVEDQPAVTLSIVVQQNSRADGFMTKLRAGTQQYGRIRMVGRQIGGTTSQIDFDFPFQFKEPDRGETQRVFTGSYVCRANYDGTGSGKLETMLRITISESALSDDQKTEIIAS